MSNQFSTKISKALNSLFEGIVIINSEGEILWANNKSIEIFLAKSTNDLIGQSVGQYFHDLYKMQIIKAADNLINNKLKSFEKEVVLQINKEEFVPCKLKLEKFDDESLIIYLLNLSTEKKVEERLFETTEQINAIIKTAVDGIITIDQRGLIETLNPAAAKLFGYYSYELIGKNISVLMPEPDHSKHDGYLNNYQETRKPKIIGIGREVTGLKKNGEKFPLSLGVSEVKLTKRVIYTGIIHDLTQQKLVEEQLRRSAENLKRSNRELEDFAYVSSHDLQEPLRKIQAFGDRIKSKDLNLLSERSQDYFNRMLNASSRMQNLISDLLQFSRVSSRAKPFVSVDLFQITKEVVSDLEVSIENSKTQIQIKELPKIQADPTQMRQLFQNLISNAIKFSAEKDKPKVEIFSEVFTKQKHLIGTPGDQYVQIHIKDNGIGFDEKFTDKIFNIFSRLEGKKFEGSGIGLSICKKIVNRHGGDIKVVSKEGLGTEFIIKLATEQTA